jgi:hypothetical protein
MSGESYWVEKAQSAEAQLKTLQGNIDRIKEDARHILATFGARKQSDGSFSIDFSKLADGLGPEKALELRAVIDERYGITGAPGEKPRMRIKAPKVA